MTSHKELGYQIGIMPCGVLTSRDGNAMRYQLSTLKSTLQGRQASQSTTYMAALGDEYYCTTFALHAVLGSWGSKAGLEVNGRLPDP
jgi:hypothetical protein